MLSAICFNLDQYKILLYGKGLRSYHRGQRHIYVFPGFRTPALTQLFFSKPPTIFSLCIRVEMRKICPKEKKKKKIPQPGIEPATIRSQLGDTVC